MATAPREDAMTEPLVRVEIAGGIAAVRMNRPDRLNALDFPMAEALLAAIAQAGRDPSVKVVTLTGEGRAFMAGGDVGVFHRAGENAPQEIGRLIELFHQIVRRIRRMKPPVICGVQGAVAGGGLGLAVACDIVIAADNASFVPAYTRLGTSPDGGTTWSITRLIGQRRALEWIMLGDPINAQGAAEIGLINRVVATEKLTEEVSALAQRIAAGPAFAFASVKRLVYQATGVSFDEQLEAERDAFVAAAATKDFREGVAAFFEKRPAKFGD
jgi:2-(1,2-epoxy-1,2-dihydrophenyl)acetyl-CoA isomerase